MPPSPSFRALNRVDFLFRLLMQNKKIQRNSFLQLDVLKQALAMMLFVGWIWDIQTHPARVVLQGNLIHQLVTKSNPVKPDSEFVRRQKRERI